MALLYMDGFEGYADKDDMLLGQGECRWSFYAQYDAGTDIVLDSTTYRTTQTTPANSRSLRFQDNGTLDRNSNIGFSFPSRTEVIVGFAFRIDAILYGNQTILRIGEDNAYDEGVVLQLQSTGQLRVGTANNQVVHTGYNYGTSTAAITAGNWHYIEMRVVRGTTTTNGTIEVHLDGTQVINLTNAYTYLGIPSIGYSHLRFWYNNSYHESGNIDDFYICDTTGTVNNTFLGPVRVYSLFASGAGSSTQMTPVGAASNWEAVDEVSPDTTTYVESSTSGHLDLYNFESLPGAISISSIPGVMVKAKGTTDIDNRNVFLKIRNGANTLTSAAKNFITGAWRGFYHVAETAPDGSPWDETAVNNSEGGQEVS